jgi:hypothetical protein
LLQQIATQMTTQQSRHIDLYSLFTSVLFMRNGFTAYFVLFPENIRSDLPDRGFAHEMDRACARVSLVSPSRFTGTVAVE